MGDTIWLEVTDGHTKTGGDRDNSIILRLSPQLDALAKRLGVLPPSRFHNPGGLSWLPRFLAREAWFDAREGERTFGALVAELQARPESLGFVPNASQSHWLGMLLDELEYCRDGLAKAATQNHQFRLLLVS